MNTSRHGGDIDLFLDLFNRSLEGMWGFVPLTRPELQDLVGSLKFLMDPRFALVAEVEGKAAGIAIGVPDYNPRIKQIDGRLFPFGFLRLLSRRGLHRFCVLSLTVLPEYQRWGLGLVLLRSLLPRTRAGIRRRRVLLDLGIQHVGDRRHAQVGLAAHQDVSHLRFWPGRRR